MHSSSLCVLTSDIFVSSSFAFHILFLPLIQLFFFILVPFFNFLLFPYTTNGVLNYGIFHIDQASAFSRGTKNMPPAGVLSSQRLML
jgi:hypothetical protein